MRWIAVLSCVAACGGGEPSKASNDRVAKVDVAIHPASKYGPRRGFYLDVAFDYRPAKAPPPNGVIMNVRAACQIGAMRYVGDAPATPRSEMYVREAGRIRASPFVSDPLAIKPSLCDVAFTEQPAFGEPAVEIFRMCVTPGGAQTAGACPPNRVGGPDVGGLLVSVPELLVVKADDYSPDRVTIRFAAQAHRDIAPSTMVSLDLACRGGGHDLAMLEVGGLHLGESIAGESNVFSGSVPEPGDPCTLTFTTMSRSDGESHLISEACWSERAITVGRCP